jgi:hypothetical protein
MRLREKPQIELNNALAPIVQHKVGGPSAASVCRRLALAVRVMTFMAAAPNARVDGLSRAGLAKFEQASASCVAGDLASAEQLVTEGLAERTAAQEAFDDTLDGE